MISQLSVPFAIWIGSAVAALGWGMFLRLRGANFKLLPAAALSLLVLAQPAFVSLFSGLRSALFSLAAFATASSAAAFARRQDPRRIVLFGGSLAGTQLIHPMCGTMTTLVLPWVLRRSFGDTFRGRTVGLYLSVLFIPAMVSIALVFLFFVQHVHLPKWPVLAMRATSSDFVPSLFIVASAVPLAVATLRCHVPVTRSVLATTGSMILVTSLILELFVGGHQWALSAAGLSPLLVVALVDGSQGDGRRIDAFVLLSASALLIWTLFLSFPEYGNA
jgi:hypothetical protein